MKLTDISPIGTPSFFFLHDFFFDVSVGGFTYFLCSRFRLLASFILCLFCPLVRLCRSLSARNLPSPHLAVVFIAFVIVAVFSKLLARTPSRFLVTASLLTATAVSAPLCSARFCFPSLSAPIGTETCRGPVLRSNQSPIPDCGPVLAPLSHLIGDTVTTLLPDPVRC